MNEPIKGEAMIMKNMPQMAQFVYDFYNQKINRLMSQHEGGRQTKVKQFLDMYSFMYNVDVLVTPYIKEW